MNFYQEAGPMALGSRIRQISERLTQEATKIYRLYGMEIEPRWFPVLYLLSQNNGQSVAQIAQAIGHSQASVSQIIQQMQKYKFVTLHKAPDDGRKTIVTLSDKAQNCLPALHKQIEDVGQALDQMLVHSQHNIWKALDELEYLLDQQSLFERVNQERKQRERNQVQIVDYSDQYYEAFRQLNYEWITKYFVLEDSDHQALNHPNEKIIQPGGAILMAIYQDAPVGTCALIRIDDTTYELAKMAVTEKARGKHIGWLLGQAILQKAREIGAKKVYLESNTTLKPAINLYHKLGFQRIKGVPSPYQRCNIQMEVIL